MRLAQTSILIAALLTTAPFIAVAGSDGLSVSEINNQISATESQYHNVRQERQQFEEQLESKRSELEQARERNSALESERRSALEQMNRRYRELVDNPDLDISEVQKAYQEAVANARRNEQRVEELARDVASLRSNAERSQLREHSLQNQLATYEERLQLARVDRLLNEFNSTTQVRVSQEVTCERNETISQCEDRADLMAKQRASSRFLTGAFESLTESSTAMRNKDKVSPNVRVIGSRPVESGFTGGRQYSLNVDVELQGRMERAEVCNLLEIDARYCADNIQADNEGASDRGKKPSDEGVIHRVLVRSNVHNDQVILNGERHGSTPVELMLESGEYELAVNRRGYTSYSTTLRVGESKTYWANLQRLAYEFTPGEIIQDALGEYGDGPALVVIPSGSTRLGNLQRSSGDQQTVRTYEQAIPLAVAVTPVTVSQFRAFVERTGYVTTAEDGTGCHYLNGGDIVSDSAMSWESPGHSAADNMPVTCVSLNDAKAYANWLSRQSGASYRVPSSHEWEYAARGGTNTSYWWGNSIGAGRANCATCGTPWAGDSPSPVHTFAKNPYGLEDTVGNVWEWTQSNDSDVAAARGGAFNFAPALARVHTQLELYPTFSSNYVGFRVVRDE